MAGTREGGLKTARQVQAKDPDHYRKIGAIGGRRGHTGGFAADPELARLAGAKGGRISRRRKAIKEESWEPKASSANSNSITSGLKTEVQSTRSNELSRSDGGARDLKTPKSLGSRIKAALRYFG